MLVVDSQVHLWRAVRPPLLHRQVEVFWAGELLTEMRSAGVDAAVLVPPLFFPEGNELYRSEVLAHPDTFVIWGSLPIGQLASSENLRIRCDRLTTIGARFVLLTPQARRHWTDGSLDWLWPAAEQAGVPLAVYPLGHIDLIAGVAERHPALKLTIDHMCADVFARGPTAFRDLPHLLRLASFPNVSVKLSGAPAQSLEPYPFQDTHEPIKRLLGAFGPGRCFWGSDLSRLHCSYREAVTMFTEEMSWLDPQALRLVMGEALCGWLDWRPGPRSPRA